MNNSDYNDFKNWQNGDDENEMNNPNNWMPPHGFFYYGPSDNFKKMFNNSKNPEDFMEHMKDYLHMDDILNKFAKNMNPKIPNRKNSRNKQPQNKHTIFTQEDYLKLIEIRGYLAITEQFAHVKALDKLLNQIIIVPKDTK